MKLPPPLRPPERLREAGEKLAAARTAEALALLGPGEPEHLSGQAALVVARGLLDRPDPIAALRFAARAATAGPLQNTRVAALHMMGRLRSGLGQERLAAEAYLALLALLPEHRESRLLLARMLVELGWYDLALAELEGLPRPLPGWWRQVEGWALTRRATARREALALLAQHRAGQPRALPDLVRRLIRAGRLAAAEGVVRRLPPDGEATWLAAWLDERRAWPEPRPVPAFELPAEAPATLRREVAIWLMQRGEAARAELALAGLPRAAAPSPEWLLRARLLILAREPEQLEALAAEEGVVAADAMLAAKLRFTALALRGALPTLDAAALPAAPATPDGLPIVQYWDREEPPEDVAAVMASWPEHHPDRRLLRFHRATARAWLAATYGEQAAAAFDACPHPAVEADLLRYAVLVHEGGIWADADDRCRASWNGVIAAVPPRGLVAAFCDELPFYAYNAPLIARPGNPVLARALRDAIRALLRQRPGVPLRVWLATGPGLLTRHIAGDPAQVRLVSRALLHHLSTGEAGLAYKFDRASDWRPD